MIKITEYIINNFENLLTLEKGKADTLAKKIVDAFLENQKSWVQNSIQFKHFWLTSGNFYRLSDFERQKFLESVIKKLQMFEENLSIHLLGIASFNSCGYLREAALKALDDYKNPLIVPYVLIRINDSIEDIQKVSIQIIENSFQYFTAVDYLKYYYLIIRIIPLKDNDDYFLWENEDNFKLHQMNEMSYKNKKQYIFQHLCFFIKQKKIKK